MEQTLMLSIKNTYKEWANYMKQLAVSSGIPDSYRMILIFLYKNPGASQRELAAHCNVTTSAISQTVKEMRMTGYLKKEADDNDQRYVNLFLTEKGTESAGIILDKVHLADARITELLTEEKEQLLRDLIKQLSEIIVNELPE